MKSADAEKEKAFRLFEEIKIEASEEFTKLKLENEAIEAKLMSLTNKTFVEVIGQTDSHPDIPNDVTSPLPPIFGNQMCWKSRPFHFSNSLPNLKMLSWCQPNYDFTDEAEEALAEQYDRQVREYYEDECARVRASRLSTNSEQVEDPPPTE